MGGRRSFAIAAVVVGAGVAALGLDRPALVAPRPAAAAAAAENRAVVVVDTGLEVRRVCVRFTEDFISGAELLVRARPSLEPVFREYSGKGKAVCSLCGVGCPADESCLTCGGDKYWAYSRAPKGTSTFKLSGAGASSTQVRDGDVEGWRWSSGLVPAYASVDQVCGPAPGATSTTTAAPASPTTTANAASGGTTATSRRPDASRGGTGAPSSTGSTVPGTPGPADVDPTATSLLAAPPTTETLTPGPADDEADDGDAAPPTVPTGTSGSDGGGSPLGLLAAGALMVGLGGWATWLRRTRRAATSLTGQ